LQLLTGCATNKYKTSTSAVRTLLQHQDATIRAAALDAIGKSGAEAYAWVPTVAAALDDHDIKVQRAACNALRAIGPQAKDAIPSLVQAMSRHCPESEICLALHAIGGASFLPTLVAMLQSEDKEAVYNACLILEVYGSEGVEAIPYLLPALGREDDSNIVYAAQRALEKMVPTSIPVLVGALDGPLAIRSSEAICHLLSPRYPNLSDKTHVILRSDVLPVLVGQLEDAARPGLVYIIQALCCAIGRYGITKELEPAVPLLIRGLDRNDKMAAFYMQWIHSFALERMRPYINQALTDPDRKGWAAITLSGNKIPRSPDMMKVLMSSLDEEKDKDTWQLKEYLLVELSYYGADASEVTPLLVSLAFKGHIRSGVRLRAVETLLAVGGSDAALQALQVQKDAPEFLQNLVFFAHPDGNVPLWAIAALPKVMKPPEARRVLLELRGNEKLKYQEKCRDAIERALAKLPKEEAE
jgi:hypothetical protein